jgi:membrane protein DedA with SNARE-associated domain
MALLSDTILRLAGPVVPGELALVVGGVLAHQGRVPLWAAVVAGADGAVMGDSLGYAIGHTVGDRLLARIPRRLVEPRQVQRATALLRRLGGRAVFVGRFTPPCSGSPPVRPGARPSASPLWPAWSCWA